MLKNIQCPNCDNVSIYGEHCQCCSCALPEHFSPNPDLYHSSSRVGEINNFDPLIERQLARARHQIYRPASGSTQEGEISVIFRVPENKILPKYCREILRIKRLENNLGKRFDLVTVRVPILRISEIDQDFIIKCSSGIRPCLETVHQAIKLPEPNKPKGGKPVARSKPTDYKTPQNPIVGIVDFGLDFTHEHFLHNKKTRILALWDQSGTLKNRNSRDVKYGTLYREEEINDALLSDQPYQTLGYEPPIDSLYDAGAHGTYVADVAAGNGYNNGGIGIAPDADIIFVDIARYANHNVVGSRYGDSAHLLEAVSFIFEEVKRIEISRGIENIPLVINLSVGSNDGPHDGYTPVEIGIDRLIEAKGNSAVVVAAGNSADLYLHAKGKVKKDSFLDILWYIPPYDTTSNEIELWHSMQDKFAVQILDPDNAPLCKPVECGKYTEISMGSEGSIIVFNRETDPYNDFRQDHEQKAAIYVCYERCDGYLKKGRWKLRLFARSIGKDGSFDAWIERDERGQSVFVKPNDNSYEILKNKTLNSIANGKNTIVVGSYEVDKNSKPHKLSTFSSFNLKHHDGLRPHILAPGKSILAARSRTSFLRYRQSGTSLSAAVVTGVIARMFAINPELKHFQIKDILKSEADTPLPIDGSTHKIVCLNAENALKKSV